MKKLKVFELKDEIWAQVEWVPSPIFFRITYYKLVKKRCNVCIGRGCPTCYESGSINNKEEIGNPY